jgi:hypothetical protein
MGYRQTGTRKKTDRDTDRHGQGHKWTRKRTKTDMDRDKYTDMNNLRKHKRAESVKFLKSLQN